MTNRKRIDILVSLDDRTVQALEDGYIRMMSALSEQKSRGLEPKSLKITEALIKSCVFLIGMERFSGMGWKEFKELCSKYNLKIHRGRY